MWNKLKNLFKKADKAPKPNTKTKEPIRQKKKG